MTDTASLLARHERDLTAALSATDFEPVLLQARSYLARLTQAQVELRDAAGAASCIAAEWGENGLAPAIRDVLSSARFHGFGTDAEHQFHAILRRHAA